MAATGFLYTLLLFLCSFGAVHVIKPAKIGLDSLKAKPNEEEVKEKKPKKTEKAQPQPVYYIVEKKRARKASYSAPREISFTDGKK